MSSTIIRRIAIGSASAAALAVGFTAGTATPASAQITNIYSGGATLPAIVYRQIFNCYATNASPTTTNAKTLDIDNQFDAPGCTAPLNRPYRFGYAPVGSGGGQRSFILHDSSRLGVPSATSNTVPYASNAGLLPNSPTLAAGAVPFSTSAPTGYPTHHFSGSDATVPQTGSSPTIASFDCYQGNTAADPACTTDQRTLFGQAIQVPTLTTTVNTPFRLPGKNALKLSRAALCGIFTGNITDWNNSIITQDNGGSVTGGTSRQILVGVRADGSGTTFLFTSHLNAVCTGGTDGLGRPIATWTGGVGTSVTWPSNYFYARSGNDGVAQFVATQNFAIGYTTPELTQPAVTTITVPATSTATDVGGLHPKTVAAGTYSARPRASVQNQAGFLNPALAYVLPTQTSGTTAMSSSVPPSGSASLDPAIWGVAGLVPNPTNASAYPISGFTWYLGYSCYASTAIGQGLRNFWSWYTTGSNPQLQTILNGKTFGRIPGNWNTAIRSLVVSGATTRIAGVAEGASGNSTCTGKPGA